MESHDLPKCLCGTHDWQSNGVSYAIINQLNFGCPKCHRVGFFLSAYGCAGFITSTDAKGKIENNHEYLNDILLVTWRARGEEIEEAHKGFQECKWAAFLEAFSLPSGIQRGQMSETVKEAAQIFWDEFDRHPEYRKPSRFAMPPLPPKLPASLTVFLLVENGGDKTWRLVKHQETRQLEVPPDPIKVRHDNYYGPFFAELSQKLGMDIVRREVSNEYCGARNQPWFEFMLGTTTFIVGPRKRVTAIKVKAPNGIPADEIRTVALADDVTYQAYNQNENGGWKAELSVVYALEVHAWDKEQLEKYLLILGKIALQAEEEVCVE